MGKKRENPSDGGSGQGLSGTFVSVVAARKLAGLGKFCYGSLADGASSPCRRQNANRLGESGAGRLASVVEGEVWVNRCWKPAQPLSPSNNNTTSPTLGGRLMAFPPASFILLPISPSRGPNRSRFASHADFIGTAKDADTVDSTFGLARIQHNCLLQKKVSNCRIPHNVNNKLKNVRMKQTLSTLAFFPFSSFILHACRKGASTERPGEKSVAA